MYTIYYTKRFKNDVDLMKRQQKNLKKLEAVIEILVAGQRLPLKHREHKLVGDFVRHTECHIEPDWLLIYRIEENCIYFERTGSHSNLFK